MERVFASAEEEDALKRIQALVVKGDIHFEEGSVGWEKVAFVDEFEGRRIGHV
jgi:hypothetical protein